MKTVRLYGFTADHGSFAQVTRGFQGAFLAHGYTEETLDVVSLESEDTFDEEPHGIPTADVGLLIGPPNAAGRLTQGAEHKERLVYVMPNSSKLPERMMHTVNTFATKILAPSTWAASVIQNYTTLPIVVVPLGISEEFRPVHGMLKLYDMLSAGLFSVVHFSSSDGERKGTRQVVEAFVAALQTARLPPASELRLVLTPRGTGQVTDLLSDLRATGARPEHLGQIKLVGRLGPRGAEPARMAHIFGMVHVVCQPSRGEAFGMVPLEALASGTPVVATRCTGHSEWFSKFMPGVVPVETGELAPIDDMPGALAPALRLEAVEESLVKAYDAWRGIKEEAMSNAGSVRHRWAWKNKLREFIETL